MTKPRTGTLTERSTGVWRLQATSDPDAVTGETRRISRAFRGTKSEATSALQRFVSECGVGLQAGSVVTIAVLLEQFMTTATLDPTTRQDWQSVVNRHLLPELGHIALHRLTVRDCDHLYRRMALAGLGPSRLRNAHVILHRAVAADSERRSEYRLSPIATQLPSVEFVTREVNGTDRNALAALMLDAYRSTIDDEDEDTPDAPVAVDGYLAEMQQQHSFVVIESDRVGRHGVLDRGRRRALCRSHRRCG